MSLEHKTNSAKTTHYFVPAQSSWPAVGALALLFTALGIVGTLHKTQLIYSLIPGFILLTFMFIGWFRDVIHESMEGLYSDQMDRSFRLGMLWFIFSEIWFFGAFFGVLFYVRFITLPHFASGSATHEYLYPNFELLWPLLKNPVPGQYPGPEHAVGPWGLPALNTILLLSSGVTITIAHFALLAGERLKCIMGMICTVLLGIIFLSCQYLEYHHAIYDLGLTLSSGIYGTTFYMLTGFHGLHVTLGTIMLIVITVRLIRGHFDSNNHFGFEAVAWYWHFVDVVWLFLFVFVYWL